MGKELSLGPSRRDPHNMWELPQAGLLPTHNTPTPLLSSVLLCQAPAGEGQGWSWTAVYLPEEVRGSVLSPRGCVHLGGPLEGVPFSDFHEKCLWSSVWPWVQATHDKPPRT